MVNNIEFTWDEDPVDISAEANFIWSIANKLRGVYMPDKYGDVIIPMTIIRRFECALEKTKEKVVKQHNEKPDYPAVAFYRMTGYQFYNTSEYSLKELCNDSENIKDNFIQYINGFSNNVQEILKSEDTLNFTAEINKMDKSGTLYTVVKAFSELDLSIEKFDSIKMGYIFENLIGRFYQNVDAGQYYTGRDIIKLCVSLLISEGCEDIFLPQREISVLDQACGTGGMLSTAYTYLKHYNPNCNVRLYGQEIMGQTYAIGLAEMLIKGQSADNFKNADTFKEDCFKDKKMRFVLENPPFGTPWGGKDAKAGQEESVREEYKKGFNGRFGAGLPGTSDGQLLFIQSAVDKMDDEYGRAAIIENGSPLFSGGTSSGESQIRRWLLEQDLIEAIVQLPTDLFYNTSISTYIWILSKNKREERKGKVQLIDASNIYTNLRKALGNKRKEISPENRKEITELYVNFEQSELSKIYKNTEFIYREYTVMQPLQRSYSFSKERIENMINTGILKTLYDESKVYELENSTEELKDKEKKTLKKFKENKMTYDAILNTLKEYEDESLYNNPDDFKPIVKQLLYKINDEKIDNKLVDKIVDGLSKIDKNADIQKDKKGNTLFDKSTKDTEIVPYDVAIEDYMKTEVLPHVPDAKAFFEEDLTKKKPVIKTGAEIPFVKYFYKYETPQSTDELAKMFSDLEASVDLKIKKLFGGI